MNTIMLCIRYGLLVDALEKYIYKLDSDYKIVQETNMNLFYNSVYLYNPSIILLEVNLNVPYTVELWQERIKFVKSNLPSCKIAVIIDDDNCHEVVEDIKLLKKNGEIDGFFYASSGLKYMVDALESL